LTLWAKDLLKLLEGQPKSAGIRGGAELEEVENKIVFMLDLYARTAALLYEFQNNPNIELGEKGHAKIEELFASLAAPSDERPIVKGE